MRISLNRNDRIDWKKQDRHSWFAWYPVKVYKLEWRWLEFVRRQWIVPYGTSNVEAYWRYEPYYY